MQKQTQQQFNSEELFQDRYPTFKNWFKAHGGLERDVNFPVRFEPGDYLGISAKTQISPNTVILAVPKQLVVSVSRAKASQLKQIFPKYDIFAQEDNDDSDYNVLCLFLIMEKMKGQKSFFHPYIALLDSSETVMNWSDPQIEAISDPYINFKFIDGIRATFEPIYKTFVQIAQKHKQLFPQELTRKFFDQMYAAVMTRGFGWGLPETMLVPFADFLNHSSTGVNHYVFDKCLEHSKQPSVYIQKKHQLNLSIFPTISNQILPIDYEPNLREAYLHKNIQKLQQMNLLNSNSTPRMDPTITNPLYNMLIEPVIEDNYEDSVYLSTDSEDNDSDSEAQGLEETDQIDGDKTGQPTANKLGTVLLARKYLRFAFKQVNKDLDERFTEPKPNVNAQFEDGVKFDWWFENHQEDKEKKQTQDKYFIVSSSRKIYPNQQIYNCYGRRSNRFLLIWYGFCFQNNKYDSVPFRLWSTEIAKRTGQIIYTRFLTEVQYREGIPIGNERFNAYMLSEEFRMKSRRVDHKLMAYLRYRFLIANRVYKEFYKAREWHVNRVMAIHMEIECWLEYQKHLNTLAKVFGVDEKICGKKGEKESSEENYANARQYFKWILQNSNEQIIVRNMLAVNEILNVLYQIETFLEKKQNERDSKNQTNTQSKQSAIKLQILPKQLLSHLYKSAFDSSQKDHPRLYERLDIVSRRSRKTIRKDLKLMIREYFRILSRTELCQTLYTEFK